MPGDIKEIVVSSKDWIKWADVVGEWQPIHRDPEEARRYGLPDIIAPGMYLASLVGQNYTERGLEIKFRGDHIIPNQTVRVERNGRGTTCFKGDKRIVRISALEEIPTVKVEDMKSPTFYRTNISQESVKKFMDSIGNTNGKEGVLDIPWMYLVSLSGATLLDWKEKRKIKHGGLHGYQSFSRVEEPRFGEIYVFIDLEGEKRGFTTFNMCWVQNDRIIGKGKSRVAQIS